MPVDDVREPTIRFRRLVAGLTILAVLAIAVLARSTWPTTTSAGTSSTETVSVRVVRIQACVTGSFEQTLGQDGGLLCREVFVEVLDGPDAGQLVALDPLFAPASGVPVSSAASSSSANRLGTGPFDLGEIIQARAFTGESDTTYSYSERPRTVGVFVLSGSAIIAVLVAGYWFGARSIAIILGSVALLLVYAVPALNQALGDMTTTGTIAITTAGAVLAIILVLDGATKSKNQLIFLSSIVTTFVTVGIGQTFIALTSIGIPVSASSLVLNPVGAGASQPGFVLLGTVTGSVLVVHWITNRQVSLVMGKTPSSAGSLFFDTVGLSQQQTANGISLFVLASLSASLPLLGLFTDPTLSASAVINDEMLAATLVRVGAGVLGLVLASPIATGIAAVLAGPVASTPTRDRSGEIQNPRPPLRRQKPSDEAVIDLRTTPAEPGEATRTTGPDRLRVGVNDL